MCSGRSGWVKKTRDAEISGVVPLFETIIEYGKQYNLKSCAACATHCPTNQIVV